MFFIGGVRGEFSPLRVLLLRYRYVLKHSGRDDEQGEDGTGVPFDRLRVTKGR